MEPKHQIPWDSSVYSFYSIQPPLQEFETSEYDISTGQGVLKERFDWDGRDYATGQSQRQSASTGELVETRA
jgi:hypothetical protein